MNSMWAFLASIAMIWSTLYNYLPERFRIYISSLFEQWTSRFTSEVTMVFQHCQGSSVNQLFQAANIYLGESLPTVSVPRVMVEKTENVRNLTFAMGRNTVIVDVFQNIPLKWRYSSEEYNQGTTKHYSRWYELSFHKKWKDMVTRAYLPHVLERANNIKERNRAVKLHTFAHEFWTTKPLIIQHPMTFETLAMNDDLKRALVEDLDRFMNGKEYYKQIGKVWKRGYLLYGPPGTGKSSLIAAMANHLNFDIYYLNLSAVSSDLALQNLLLSMANRSILVIEDIDCSLKLKNRESNIEQPVSSQQHNKISLVGSTRARACSGLLFSSMMNPTMLLEDMDPGLEDVNPGLPLTFPSSQVTLSGLLNFFDGILSCCGEGKILVATTNYKDRIDPALLRPGRMDMHIYMTYCTFSAFKQLALKYLEISDHSLFQHIEKIIPEVKVSPAEVAGELMKTRDPKASLRGLIKYLKNKLLTDGNSDVSPGYPSSYFHPSSCLGQEYSISLPLASKETSMDNGLNLDVLAYKQKATMESNLIENRPQEESGNNTNKKDLIRGQSSSNNILEVIEDMEKELLSYKEAIKSLQKKSSLTLNKLAEIKNKI